MSKRQLKAAKYSANKLVKKLTRSGELVSFASQADARVILNQCARQLYDKFQLANLERLKTKHVEYLVKHWQTEGLANSTIKNRMAILRKVLRSNHHPADKLTNQSLGIGKRRYHGDHSKAIWDIDLSGIEDKHLYYAARLQQAFGLRREESMKIIPAKAMERHAIRIYPTWSKGNIERLIPITNDEQRELINEVIDYVGKRGSLIPKGKTYRQHLQSYKAMCQQQGFKNLHGLRHAYAQRLYRTMTHHFTNGNGWECSFNGGKRQKEMSAFERQVDQQVRLLISAQLGHSREAITRIYLGN